MQFCASIAHLGKQPDINIFRYLEWPFLSSRLIKDVTLKQDGGIWGIAKPFSISLG